MRALVFLLFSLMFAELVVAVPLGDCSTENDAVKNDSNVVFCESFEQSAWYQGLWVSSSHAEITSGSQTSVNNHSIVSATDEGVPCVSGNCLRFQIENGGFGGFSPKLLTTQEVGKPAGKHLSMTQPEELYLSYYIYLGDTFEARNCYAGGATYGYFGGKFPGLAHERTSAEGSCGNGGANSETGTRCWTMRGDFSPVENVPTPSGASTYMGSYFYTPGVTESGRNFGWGPEWAGPGNQPPNSCQNDPSDLECGFGNAGVLTNGKWFHIEMYVKMNTPGQNNGWVQGWVDGVKGFEKENIVFRKIDHENLFVRTVWLNIFHGGAQGSCSSEQVYLDQLLVHKNLGPDNPLGRRVFSGDPPDLTPPDVPSNLQAN